MSGVDTSWWKSHSLPWLRIPFYLCKENSRLVLFILTWAEWKPPHENPMHCHEQVHRTDSTATAFRGSRSLKLSAVGKLCAAIIPPQTTMFSLLSYTHVQMIIHATKSPLDQNAQPENIFPDSYLAWLHRRHNGQSPLSRCCLHHCRTPSPRCNYNSLLASYLPSL